MGLDSETLPQVGRLGDKPHLQPAPARASTTEALTRSELPTSASERVLEFRERLKREPLLVSSVESVHVPASCHGVHNFHADRQSTPRWLGLTGHGRHAVSLFRGVGMGAPSPFEFRFHGASAVIAPRASAPPHTSSTHFSLTPLVTYRHPRAFVVGFVQHFRDEELQRRTPHLPRHPRAQPVVDSNHHSAPPSNPQDNPV